MNIFNLLYKLISRFNAYTWKGFLGELPNDILSSIYTCILRLSNAKIGKRSRIHHRVNIWNPENIEIGENVNIPGSVDMAGMGKIKIGNDSNIGASVRFITNSHPYNENVSPEEKQKGRQAQIELKNNVFIMNNVLLIAGKNGITIGEYSWVAAAAVVVSNVEPYSLYGGIPAKKIKEIIYESN